MACRVFDMFLSFLGFCIDPLLVRQGPFVKRVAFQEVSIESVRAGAAQGEKRVDDAHDQVDNVSSLFIHCSSRDVVQDELILCTVNWFCS